MTGNAHVTFRQFLPDLGQPRFTTLQQKNAHEYAESFKRDGEPPWLHALWLHWRELFAEPFRGITNDGVVKPGLFDLRDEGVPVTSIAAAAEELLSLLDWYERERIIYHIDSPEWRSWSNPEFLLSNKGIRLDEVPNPTRDAALNLLRLTLSPEGYEKALGAMRMNGFLGRLVNAPRICNEFSYNLALFGAPSATKPWGFSFYGHHLCLNILLYRNQIVVSPCFTGAEPNLLDDENDPYHGTQILREEDRLGVALMQSLPSQLQSRAQIFKLLHDPAMLRGRWNHDDQRHLCGAYRDNRVVPYEGVRVSDMESTSQELVTAILEQFLLYLPRRAREMRLTQARGWYHETWFSWIGGFDNDDAFYYRIQSPVIIVEFDHHSGVFLTNKEPARFHIHTILRTPNAGDYGMALRPLMQGAEQNFVWGG
ncbi:uncharacterized protein CC84DRAFT_1159756 [Paraphaeosphaeria sporulosa]|uniref:DUF3500 domain-containing protein n=1 Tax=Paraphaeosphaeria sporulosa TaxID=1460663 RepID=A0A177CXZ7_9PLEO|nr:uncharacterized protein CC84DRAFT_1159756 [Paraphaeosphaeria sporulosa]OAG12435.1 hypothetical protein CC84DRAFT_1159756 [Paraphaeosphaeria sporulosa]